MTGEWIRYIMVLMWLGMIFFYHLSTNTESIYDDILTDHSEKIDGYICNQLKNNGKPLKKQAKSHYIYMKRNHSDSLTVNVEECKCIETAVRKEDDISSIDNCKYQSAQDVISRINDFSTSTRRENRNMIFKSREPLNLKKLKIINQLLSYGTWIGLAFWVLFIFKMLKWWPFQNEQSGKRTLLGVTIAAISMVGILHGMIIAVQGGIFVSPMGNIASMIAAILASQTAILIYHKKDSVSCVRKILWWIPLIVFVVANIVGHIASITWSSYECRILMKDIFSIWFYVLIFFGVLGGAASIYSRVKQVSISSSKNT